MKSIKHIAAIIITTMVLNQWLCSSIDNDNRSHNGLYEKDIFDLFRANNLMSPENNGSLVQNNNGEENIINSPQIKPSVIMINQIKEIDDWQNNHLIKTKNQSEINKSDDIETILDFLRTPKNEGIIPTNNPKNIINAKNSHHISEDEGEVGDLDEGKQKIKDPSITKSLSQGSSTNNLHENHQGFIQESTDNNYNDHQLETNEDQNSQIPLRNNSIINDNIFNGTRIWARGILDQTRYITNITIDKIKIIWIDFVNGTIKVGKNIQNFFSHLKSKIIEEGNETYRGDDHNIDEINRDIERDIQNLANTENDLPIKIYHKEIKNHTQYIDNLRECNKEIRGIAINTIDDNNNNKFIKKHLEINIDSNFNTDGGIQSNRFSHSTRDATPQSTRLNTQHEDLYGKNFIFKKKTRKK